MDDERLELALPSMRWESAYRALIDDFEAAGELGRVAGRSGGVGGGDSSHHSLHFAHSNAGDQA